jgi:dUTP diphosphatase
MRLEILFKRLHQHAVIPTKAFDGDLGWDLYAAEDVVIHPESNALVSTGIACVFPDGVGAILKDRSGISSKHRVYVHAGVIDNGYTGEIKVLMDNPTRHGAPAGLNITFGQKYPDHSVRFNRGDKIAQMVLVPIVDVYPSEIEYIDETERNTRGFGSTGS